VAAGSRPPIPPLTVVAGGGHLMLFDSPAEVAPHVATFLGGWDARDWTDTLAS
jgi:hypothetical protein